MKYSALIVVALALVACKKDPEPEPAGMPTTYSFANVNYSGQTYRMNMLEEIMDYADSAKSGFAVDANILKNMFANLGSPFSDSTLNNCGKQLKNKCYSSDQSLIETYFDSIAIASTSGTAGSNGVAGVVVSSTNPSKQYCLSANGFDYNEMVEKSIMASCFYYQAIATYLENIATDDNITIVAGQGTAMEHHFDEAFGYFGVPKNFPSNAGDARFWGKYCNDLNAVLSSNNMMNYFIGARSAITTKNYSLRDANISLIRTRWDILCAASAIHELNEAMANFSDDAIRNHVLSEAYAFVNGLKYNTYAAITASQITDVLNYIGTNLYAVTQNDLLAARDLLSSIYNLDSVKTIL